MKMRLFLLQRHFIAGVRIHLLELTLFLTEIIFAVATKYHYPVHYHLLHTCRHSTSLSLFIIFKLFFQTSQHLFLLSDPSSLGSLSM
jgi:hypothetical protein